MQVFRIGAISFKCKVSDSSNKPTIRKQQTEDDRPVTSTAKLQFTMNGGAIILTNQHGHETLIVNANARASSASMLDSGNFKIHLYGANDNSNFTHHMAKFR
jgi:hypothetical protein